MLHEKCFDAGMAKQNAYEFGPAIAAKSHNTYAVAF
jgi:hypothetical protein